MRYWIPLVTLTLFSSTVLADPMEARVKLRDGRIETADVSAALLSSFGLKGVEFDCGSVELKSLEGTTFIRALNTALGEGCNVRVSDEALVLKVDPKKLPRNLSDAKLAVRTFTAVAAPDATAAQRRFYGMLLPQHVDPDRRMVVLVHGLDCNRTNWFPMADLLVGEGFQIAYFTYPSDGPLEDSAAMLAREMTQLRERFPNVSTDIIAHSMGGLVARRYVEGDAYAGGVEHLILLGTPNLGSRWATYRLALEVEEHWQLFRREKDWSPTWMITDGLGEAGRDLKPTSRFLTELNSRPRRAGVAYTIVAGAQHPVYTMTGNTLDSCADIVPQRASKWWGLRHTVSALRKGAKNMHSKTGSSDGPVSVKSTQLQGVDDYLCLPVDHVALYYPVNGQQPAAWDVIKDRLSR